MTIRFQVPWFPNTPKGHTCKETWALVHAEAELPENLREALADCDREGWEKVTVCYYPHLWILLVDTNTYRSKLFQL